MKNRNVSLSLCMIVKNEADNLPRCLKSVADFVDEMIIVDTGSQDDTVKIAKQFGANVHHFEWRDNFSAAKNAALSHAGSQWILVLDADEEWLADSPAQSGSALRKLLEKTDADALRLKVRNRMPADELAQFQEFYLTRLFRNRPEFRYEGRIHEQIRPAISHAGGKMFTADFVILHHGYAQKTVQGGEKRTQRNLRLLHAALAESPKNPYLIYHLGATYQEMGNSQKALTTLSRAVKLDQGILSDSIREKLFLKLAQIAFAGNDNPTARGYALECLGINPQNLTAQYIASLSLVFEKRFAEALEGFQRIRKHPNLNPHEVPQIEQVINYCTNVSRQVLAT